MKVYDYERAMTQAEAACNLRVAHLLGLSPGKDATIGISNGYPDAAVFDIGQMQIGETNTFNAGAVCFSATLTLYNRDRSMLQRWLMRLVGSLPVNADYRPDDAVREDANVLHFRITPSGGAISRITPTTVQSSNSGDVPTWTAEVQMDAVYALTDATATATATAPTA